jgi:hypothetical protein
VVVYAFVVSRIEICRGWPSSRPGKPSVLACFCQKVGGKRQELASRFWV